MEDTSTYPALFAALMSEETDDGDAWTDDELAKLAQGNILRVIKQVENVRDGSAVCVI